MRVAVRRAAIVLLSGALAVAVMGAVPITRAAANTFLPCHDNTTWSGHTGHWTHGDPIAGIPGDPRGGSGYYYLSIQACGPIVEGTVYSPGEWDLDISPDFDHTNELAAVQFHGTAGRVFITNATAGWNYRLRVANISTHVQRDYAELSSGSPNDGQGDCGGPGPEMDPNTHNAPVDPPPTPGLPVMGCRTASSVAPSPLPASPTAFPASSPARLLVPEKRAAAPDGRTPPAAPRTPSPRPRTSVGPPVALGTGMLSPSRPAPKDGSVTVIPSGARGSFPTTDWRLSAAAAALVGIAIITAFVAARRRGAG